MNTRIAIISLVALLTGGCLRFPVAPELHTVDGAVHYLQGDNVNHAKVWVPGGAATFSDSLGRFRIAVRAGVDSILWARDGYDSRGYVVTCSGRVRIAPLRPWQWKDIVLTQCSPI